MNFVKLNETTTIKQGDTKRTFTAFLHDENNGATNLTNATVTFILANRRDAVINKPATIVSATGGEVSFSFDNDDVTGTGYLDGELRVTYTGGVQESFPTNGYMKIRVEPNLLSRGEANIPPTLIEQYQQTIDGQSALIQENSNKVDVLSDRTSGALNVKTYNVKGDGVTDDTQFLQQIFIDAYRNKKSVEIPAGDYLISKPILIFADSYELNSSISVDGENLENVRIRCAENFTAHSMSGVLANTSALLVVNETFLNSDDTFKNGSGSAHSVFINNVYLFCQYDNVDYGLCFGVTNASSSYKRVRTRGFKKAGIKNLSNFYLNVLEKIRVDNSPVSYDLSQGIKTSVKMDSLYSTGATLKAYDISGVYMNMTNCCADNCTGVVFDLDDYKGVVNNPGSESSLAKTVFKGGVRTNVIVNAPHTFGNFTDPEAIHIHASSGAQMIFNGGKVLHDDSETNKIAEGYFIKRGTSSLLQINNVLTGKYKKNNDFGDINVYSKYETTKGSFQTRHGDDISYLGFDGWETNGYIDFNSQTPKISGNAIFFDFGASPSYKSDGKDVRFHRPNRKGDIILSKIPEQIGGIGWVQASTIQEENWSRGNYLKIPVVLSGTTAERPTVGRTVGQQFFDTTLGKPVWWKGSGWVDALGTIV